MRRSDSKLNGIYRDPQNGAGCSSGCEDKKGEETRVLELDPMDSGFTDFFLITSSSTSGRHRPSPTRSNCAEKEFATYPNSVEGRRQGEWILMDYVDFVVPYF